MGLMDTLKKMFGGGGDTPTEAPQEEAPQEESSKTPQGEENTQM